MKKIGYWKINKQSIEKLPYPQRSDEDNSEFIKKLLLIEEKIKKRELGEIIYYKGYSQCRLCEEEYIEDLFFEDKYNHTENGNAEYTLDLYQWPEGYIHYVKKHNIKVDREFKHFILNTKI